MLGDRIRFRPGAPSRLAAALLSAGVLSTGILGACSSEQTLLESDVPLPPKMESVRSADIRRTGGTVSGGRFVLAGEVNDARNSLDETIERYRSNGWSVVESTRGLDHSTAVFRKGSRTATISIERRTLSPDMSSGSLVIVDGAATQAGG
jgi:hypothetical protein